MRGGGDLEVDRESIWARLRWRISNEPAFIAGLLELVIGLLFAFEVIDWTGEQVGAVMALVGFLTGVAVRQTTWGPKTVGDQLAAMTHAVEAAAEPAQMVVGANGEIFETRTGPTSEEFERYFRDDAPPPEA